MEFLILLVLLGIAVLWDAFAWGFVFMKFWYWFVLPVFTDLPQVGFLSCVGLVLFLTLFKNHSMPQIKKEYREENYAIVSLILTPVLTLAIGWFVKLFIQ